MDTKIKVTTNINTGWRALLSGQNKIKAIGLAGGVALHATNVYLVTTILPSVVQDIGGLQYYAWNTTIFVVASIIGSVVSARNLAIQGPRKAYRLAIILFSIGTVMCMLAPAMYVMLAGRFVQGLGGGLLFALSYAMIRIVFEQTLWPRAVALVSGMWGVAALSGPFIGGVFANYHIWRAAFGFLLPVCITLLFITETILPMRKEGNAKVSIPYGKLMLLTSAALAVSIGSIMESIVANIMGVVIALLLLIILIASEKNSSNRLLPQTAYQITSPLGATYITMVLLTIATAIEIFVPYFTQVIHGFSPLKAGYLTVLMALGWTFASILFSGAKPKVVRVLLLTGPLLMFIGLAGLAYLSSISFSTQGIGFLLMCLCLILTGAGIGVGWPHLLTRVFSSARAGEEEMASASITTVQLIATAFGAALAGLVANLAGMTNPGGVAGAQDAALWLFGSFSVAPLLAASLVFSELIKR